MSTAHIGGKKFVKPTPQAVAEALGALLHSRSVKMFGLAALAAMGNFLGGCASRGGISGALGWREEYVPGPNNLYTRSPDINVSGYAAGSHGGGPVDARLGSGNDWWSHDRRDYKPPNQSRDSSNITTTRDRNHR
ncbi:MAG: hypothetical protein AB7U41_04125 [Dongiaceae bacterium]